MPGLTRVAVLWDPATGPVQVRGLESAARRVGVQLHVLEVRSVDDFEGAFRAAMPEHPDAVIALSAPLVSNHGQHLAALAVTHHLMVTDQIPPAEIFDSLADLTTRWLIIEYVGPQDLIEEAGTRIWHFEGGPTNFHITDHKGPYEEWLGKK